MPVGAPCPNWGMGCTCEDCTFPGEPPYVSGFPAPSLEPEPNGAQASADRQTDNLTWWGE